MFFQRAFEGKNDWWMYVITIVLVLIASLVGGVLILPVATGIAERNQLSDQLPEFFLGMDYTVIGMEPWVFLLFMLLPFVAMLAVLWLFVTKVHQKRFEAILTGRPRLDWKRIGFGFGFWLLLTIVVEVVSFLIQPETYTFDFQPAQFFPVLIVVLLLLPLQTSAEEIIFRGYLMQAVGLIAKNRWVPLLVTSVLFGLLHGANPEVAEYGVGAALFSYIYVGLFLGVITLMDDGLELALGVHAATNIYAATVTTYPGAALPMPALFELSELNLWMMNGVLVVSSVVFMAICARRYGWTNWKERLTGPIVPPPSYPDDHIVILDKQIG